MDWESIIHLGLASYITAWLVVEGHVLDRPRAAVQRDTPFLRFGGYHLLECRTCVSFWLCAAGCIATLDASLLMPAWAISRMISKLERQEH